MKQVLISVIIPVYNGEKYLSKSIESILNQSYNHFELIIVNDGSTDKSLQIIKHYANIDKRIKIINNKSNLKLPASLNIGHKYAKGSFITWTSDDNIAKFNFLEKLVTRIVVANVDVVFSNYDIINFDGSFRREQISGPIENLIFGNVFGASFLYKKEVFVLLNGYNESLFLVEDYDFWLRASLKFPIGYIDDNLFQYRVHSGSLTSDIEVNSKVNSKFINGINHIFNEISKELKWSVFTENLIKSLHLGKKNGFNNFLVNKKIIISDLEKYLLAIKSNNQIKFRLWYLLRNQWRTYPEHQNLKILLKVLLIQPQLLFYKEFSKKQTIIIILKCFKIFK